MENPGLHQTLQFITAPRGEVITGVLAAAAATESTEARAVAPTHDDRRVFATAFHRAALLVGGFWP